MLNESELLYLKETYSLDEFYPREKLQFPEKHINDALTDPVGSSDLRTFLLGKEKILILVNDGSRATPTALVLEEIYSSLDGLDCRYVVATGTHRDPTKGEISKIFGKYSDELKGHIYSHDCHNNLDFYGKTRRGNDVYFSNHLRWADAVIVIGSVEPHYFAGYSGGRKSLLPGIAGYDTIERNHKLALSKESEILKLTGNPIHEDMMEAIALIDKPIFSIQMVLDIQDKVCLCSAGDIRQTLVQCTSIVDQLYKIEVNQTYNIVVAIVEPPLNRNLY